MHKARISVRAEHVVTEGRLIACNSLLGLHFMARRRVKARLCSHYAFSATYCVQKSDIISTFVSGSACTTSIKCHIVRCDVLGLHVPLYELSMSLCGTPWRDAPLYEYKDDAVGRELLAPYAPLAWRLWCPFHRDFHGGQTKMIAESGRNIS